MQTILIVDDERDLREILAFNLSRVGYTTIEAASAEEAATIVESGAPIKLILLDVMMGKMNGFEFAELLKSKDIDIPVIFLTALDTEGDLLKGFSLGADDYISKPFSIAEVQARVKAVLSRSGQEEAISTIKVGNVTIDQEAKSVMIDSNQILLTKTEFQLLLMLSQKPSKTFSREELLNKVWGTDVYVEPRTVDVHIARLRKKIEGADVQIISRSGYGYSLS
ncbi:MAG: response regulator transcription factor [Rikenellaceae bacterium]